MSSLYNTPISFLFNKESMASLAIKASSRICLTPPYPPTTLQYMENYENDVHAIGQTVLPTDASKSNE